LTILATAHEPETRIDRLMWSLSVDRPTVPFDLVVVDIAHDDGLIEQLLPYRTTCPWKLVRLGGDVRLGELVRGRMVLSLPASAIPLSGAVEQVRTAAENGPVAAQFRAVGPLGVYGLDDLGSNLTPEMVEDSPSVATIGCCWRREEWAENVAGNSADSGAAFVLYPCPRIWTTAPDEFVHVVANN
jgi:hypothetical protein